MAPAYENRFAFKRGGVSSFHPGGGGGGWSGSKSWTSKKQKRGTSFGLLLGDPPPGGGVLPVGKMGVILDLKNGTGGDLWGIRNEGITMREEGLGIRGS